MVRMTGCFRLKTSIVTFGITALLDMTETAQHATDDVAPERSTMRI